MFFFLCQHLSHSTIGNTWETMRERQRGGDCKWQAHIWRDRERFFFSRGWRQPSSPSSWIYLLICSSSGMAAVGCGCRQGELPWDHVTYLGSKNGSPEGGPAAAAVGCGCRQGGLWWRHATYLRSTNPSPGGVPAAAAVRCMCQQGGQQWKHTTYLHSKKRVIRR